MMLIVVILQMRVSQLTGARGSQSVGSFVSRENFRMSDWDFLAYLSRIVVNKPVLHMYLCKESKVCPDLIRAVDEFVNLIS